MSTREEVQALGFKVPDAIEPIVAYRAWKVGPGQRNLLSINGSVWAPGRSMKAQCPYCRCPDFTTTTYSYRERHPVDETPHEKCTCGIYAAKRDEARVLVPRAPVYGEVYLWGKIQEGARGYRAQFAYPKRLFVLTGKDKKIVEKMGFGVPVLVVRGNPYGLFPFPGSGRWITNPLTALSAVMARRSRHGRHFPLGYVQNDQPSTGGVFVRNGGGAYSTTNVFTSSTAITSITWSGANVYPPSNRPEHGD